ncbi:SDR family oxidoreductase [Microbacterium esteraromaticum]|uniref:SDR family NAD(P)-dependent oxidoreductase n=1 Tax=Microbacterium esteraromaticum TaxID=57043 RepID=UPI0023685E8D|nr:SDR family oxidoreductase [Microbacterium esteraromaticum]WDH79589.1 SDR family oxidoreductase [Microbacterium esteraromaticum]
MDYTNLFRLDGRKAVAVGSASGIGRESALALAAHGAHVVCADRNLDGAEETSRLIREQGGTAEALQLDVLDSAQVFDAAAEHNDADTLLFTAATNVRKPLLDYSSDEYDRVVALNQRSSFDLIRAFGANMVGRQGGSIIGFSSIRHVVVEPGQGVYAASKAATVQLLRTAAAEFGHAGVRANAIAPGCVDTPLTDAIKATPEWYDAYASKSALGRWSKPSELAGAVVYLASDASTFVTGSVLYVDGGWTAVDGRFTPPMS